MKCQEQRNNKRCGREATAYVINGGGKPKPLCSGHFSAYMTWGGYEFGPIGNLIQPQPARQGVTR